MILNKLRALFTPTSVSCIDVEDTTGPQPVADDLTPATISSDGWCNAYTRVDAHPGRVGRAITPVGAVVHETQMHPGTFDALVRRVRVDPGKGNAYHFLIGRNPGQLVQQVSILRNANHAGGPQPATITRRVGARVTRIHPNNLIGIELHCAGPVMRHRGAWYIRGPKSAPVGAPIPEADVDVLTYERGEHRPSAWQLEQLGLLLRVIMQHVTPLDAINPADFGMIPVGIPDPDLPKLARRALPVWGHRELNPRNKSDPSRRTMQFLADHGW